jgi:hypothetical protein
MAYAEIKQTKSIITGREPRYRVTTEVITAVDFPPEIFVFKVDAENAYPYMHVASLSDLVTLPTSPAQARSEDKMFFRARYVILEFNSPIIANEAAEHIAREVRRLVSEYGAAGANFESNVTMIFDSERST